MSTYGRKILSNTGRVVMALADIAKALWKPGGITVDWATVAAVNADTVLTEDEVTVPNGQKYLRYGQVLSRIDATGLYGPFDPAASDGRQQLQRGQCFVLNETTLQNGLLGFTTKATDHPAVFEGGTVWRERILMTTGTHSLANGPTQTEFEAAFPRIGYVNG